MTDSGGSNTRTDFDAARALLRGVPSLDERVESVALWLIDRVEKLERRVVQLSDALGADVMRAVAAATGECERADALVRALGYRHITEESATAGAVSEAEAAIENASAALELAGKAASRIVPLG